MGQVLFPSFYHPSSFAELVWHCMRQISLLPQGVVESTAQLNISLDLVQVRELP